MAVNGSDPCSVADSVSLSYAFYSLKEIDSCFPSASVAHDGVISSRLALGRAAASAVLGDI